MVWGALLSPALKLSGRDTPELVEHRADILTPELPPSIGVVGPLNTGWPGVVLADGELLVLGIFVATPKPAVVDAPLGRIFRLPSEAGAVFTMVADGEPSKLRCILLPLAGQPAG